LGVAAFKPVQRDGRWITDTLWEDKDVSMYLSNLVVIGETLFGLSQRAGGQFFAIDAGTGKVLWLGPPREATNTAVVKAGNLLFLLNDDGELIVARAGRTKFEPLKQYTVAESATWAQPAMVGEQAVHQGRIVTGVVDDSLVDRPVASPGARWGYRGPRARPWYGFIQETDIRYRESAVTSSTEILIGDLDAQHLLIRPLSRRQPGLFDDRDANRIDCDIEVAAGAFRGSFRADLRSEEFRRFLEDLEALTRTQDHVASFTTVEGHLALALQADGSGRIRVAGEAIDEAGNRLQAGFDIDQSRLPEICRSLEHLLAAFPVIETPDA
jgi:hypothetical protein